MECNEPTERDGKLVGRLKIDDDSVRSIILSFFLKKNPKKKTLVDSFFLFFFFFFFFLVTEQTDPAHWVPSPGGNDRVTAKTIRCDSSYRGFGKRGSRTWK